MEKSSPTICTTSVNFKKTAQSEQAINRRKFVQSGHPAAYLLSHTCQHCKSSHGFGLIITRKQRTDMNLLHEQTSLIEPQNFPGTRRPGFESHQGIRFLGKHSSAFVYKSVCKYALCV
jgi:hypothetical protein